jgi:uncharacterized protein
MKIVVAGGSGFLGEPLVQRLLSRGDDVAVLTRNPSSVRAGRPLEWHPPQQGAWSSEAASADVVINLAGENIGEGRWTAERKRRLIASRLDATSAIVAAMAGGAKPQTLVNASAVGYYGPRGDEVLDESAPRGKGFLAELVEKWEAAARQVPASARLVILRFGVVLDAGGGALAKMLLPFRLGAGGPIGSGQQWMSWVDRGDVVRAIEWAIDRREARDVYNITAPEPVRQRDFAKALGRAVHRPAVIPTPAFALRLLFGEMADEALLSGQRVIPARTEREGFAFEARTVEESLRRISASR